VWDTGPQYPDMWPEGEDATTPPATTEDVPSKAAQVSRVVVPPQQVPATTPPPPTARKGPRPPGWWQRTVLGFPIWLVLAFAVVVVVVFALIATSGDPGTDAADRVQSTGASLAAEPQPLPTTPAVVAVASAPPTTMVRSTELPSSIVSAAPAPTIVTPGSVAPAPIAPTTVAPVPAATTVQPAPTVAPDGPAVTIIGRVGPCDYGSQCLLAGFALHNFATQPTDFVCEFSDGSRYTFHFTRQQVERACATGDPTDSITIEVDGVRSAPFRRP